jgi:hypothetical protein
MRPASLFEIQGYREASTPFAEREPIVPGGTRQLREGVGVGETRGDKVSGGRSSERWWITAGEQVAPRGVRARCEGKTLKGGSQELAVA